MPPDSADQALGRIVSLAEAGEISVDHDSMTQVRPAFLIGQILVADARSGFGLNEQSGVKPTKATGWHPESTAKHRRPAYETRTGQNRNEHSPGQRQAE